MDGGGVPPSPARGQGGTGGLCAGVRVASVVGIKSVRHAPSTVRACQLWKHAFWDCMGAQTNRCILQFNLPAGVSLLLQHIRLFWLPTPADLDLIASTPLQLSQKMPLLTITHCQRPSASSSNLSESHPFLYAKPNNLALSLQLPPTEAGNP